ncbi:hypothetical protein ACFOON_12325 [Novosphingobium piscinae]|uniref:Uncharacterized protein n=1 Tax=Novosphingobium piscinae TaxID=1507448 RepID=A0A7X1FX90_9SPHN|nr:hypothetical protein [Novosphingobium piscinae]MBC2667997.1 hypothetical protein [Novosphingobium piscinae]
MRKLTQIAIATLLPAALLGTATSASAHPGDGYGYGNDLRRESAYRADIIRDQLADLARRVDRNDNRDRISEREAAALRREIRDVRQQVRWFSRDGLDRREMRILQARVDRVGFALRAERRDWDGRPG